MNIDGEVPESGWMGFPAKEVMGLHLSVGSNPTLSAKLKQSISAIKVNLGLVAQLDRASVYGTEGSGFESLLARLNSFWIR